MWPWLTEWFPFLIPALANFFLVLAGIWMSLPKFADAVETNPRSKRRFGWFCFVLGIVALTYDARERHHTEQSSQELFNKVKASLDNTDLELHKTDALLDEMSTVETGVSLVPGLDAKINKLQSQLSVAIKARDTIREAQLKKELSDANAAKTALLKQVISNAKLVAERLRDLARIWSEEEARAKDDKERDRIHGRWNTSGLPLGNAFEATRQLLPLLPESSSDQLKELQLQEMKIHGQGFGGTGPQPLKEDADYLDALIKRVIAANPELAQ